MCATPASDRLLSTAADLFYRRGIRAVGIDTVVSDSGVAKMTLYKHFASKDLLVAAALDQQGKQWRDWFEVAVLAAGTDARSRLLAMFDVLGGWLARDDFRGCALINAALELREQEHPARAIIQEHKSWLRDFVLGLVREARLAEPQCSADALVLLIEGAIVGAQVGVAKSPASTAKCTATLLIDSRSPRDGVDAIEQTAET